MAEVLFYHLTASPLEATLPDLLERSLARGWRVVVRLGSDATLRALDAHLWTFRDDAFLPHGGPELGHAAAQPVYLTTGDEVPNRADVLMLADGARADWRAVKAADLPAKYWAQEQGRWVQKA